jgi:hypothetical protein
LKGEVGSVTLSGLRISSGRKTRFSFWEKTVQSRSVAFSSVNGKKIGSALGCSQFSHAQWFSVQSEWGINQSVQPWVNQFSHSQWLSVQSEWGKKSDSSAMGKSVQSRSMAFSSVRMGKNQWVNQFRHAQWLSVQSEWEKISQFRLG